MYVPSTLLKNCITFYLAKYTVDISALQHYIGFRNSNWYVSIWNGKSISLVIYLIARDIVATPKLNWK